MAIRFLFEKKTDRRDPSRRLAMTKRRLLRRGKAAESTRERIFKNIKPKIIESCRSLGTPDPEYTVLGDDLTVRFTALKCTLMSSKDPKDQSDTLDATLAEKILVRLKEQPNVTQEELAKELKVSLASIKRTMKKLSDSGRIIRSGGKRFGHWTIQ